MPSPNTSPDSTFRMADSTGYLVNMAARLLARRFDARLREHGATLGEWPYLVFLWEEDGLTQRELSRRILVAEPTTVRTIDRMERDGLVKRVRNNRDRRQIGIHLTEEGHRLREVLIPLARDVNASALEGLSSSDRTRINELLRHMIDSLGGDIPLNS